MLRCPCFCFFQEREEEEEEDRSRLQVSATSGILYVVECVRLTLEMEDDPISLFKGGQSLFKTNFPPTKTPQL